MNKRKLLIALLVAGLFTAGLGAGLVPASADQRTFRVTFVGGTTTVVTLDIPAGTPLDQVTVPGVSLPVLSIEEVTPASSSTPTVAVPPAETTTGENSSSDSSAADAEPVGGTHSAQKTTGHHRRKAQAETETPVADIVKATKDEAAKAATDEGGAPTPADASYSYALPGPTPIGVPNFFIEKF